MINLKILSFLLLLRSFGLQLEQIELEFIE